jgi:hypothetical protein
VAALPVFSAVGIALKISVENVIAAGKLAADAGRVRVLRWECPVMSQMRDLIFILTIALVVLACSIPGQW